MNASQQGAVRRHRRRLAEQGLARYEVRGLAKDKELVRRLAKRLAHDGPDTERLRREITQEVALSDPDWPRTGKDIWDALRRSPLFGLDLDIEREVTPGRDVEL